MAVSAFADKDKQPHMKDVLEVVGARRALWESLSGFMVENYRVEGELKHYGKNYGWMVRFRRGGKTLVALFPRTEGFVAQVVLGLTIIDAANEMKLGKNVRAAFEEANQYFDGRWLYVDRKSPFGGDRQHFLCCRQRGAEPPHGKRSDERSKESSNGL